MPKPAPKEDTTMTGSGPYVMAYMLLILCIALGLMVVCRSASRRDRARPEEYAESGLADDAGPKRGKRVGKTLRSIPRCRECPLWRSACRERPL